MWRMAGGVVGSQLTGGRQRRGWQRRRGEARALNEWQWVEALEKVSITVRLSRMPEDEESKIVRKCSVKTNDPLASFTFLMYNVLMPPTGEVIKNECACGPVVNKLTQCDHGRSTNSMNFDNVTLGVPPKELKCDVHKRGAETCFARYIYFSLKHYQWFRLGRLKQTDHNLELKS